MLLVKTDLKPSPIHGLGVFAAEFIPAGTKVWEYIEGFDHRLSQEFINNLPKISQEIILHYSAFWGGGYVVSADDARFLNHSDLPNLLTSEEPDIDIAIKDIQIGEELLENYREFDQRFADRLINA
jgi:hypothetical protein